MKKFFTLWSLIVSISLLFAQQSKPNIKWKKFEGENFSVIFPETYSKEAFNVFRFLEENRASIYDSLKTRNKKTPVVLINHSAISNGYATLIPRKSQWYMTPPPSPYFGGAKWSEILGTHEIRHMAQFDASNYGLIRLLRILSGAAGHTIGMGLAYPAWYFEGDAVFKESMLTGTGRAYSGDFSRPVKMIINRYPAKYQNYYRFFYRSYNRFYPSHYHLGFFLMAYLNRHHPNQVYHTLKTANFLSFFPGGYHLALALKTKLSYPALTDSTFHEIKRFYHPQTDTPDHSKRVFSPPKHDYVNQMSPHFIGDTLYFTSSSFNHLPALYKKLPGGQVKKLFNLPTNNVSMGNRLIAWTEYRPHPRFQEEGYSDILIQNIQSARKYRLTNQGNFHSPYISPDDKELVAVYYNLRSVPALAFFDLHNRKATDTIFFSQLNAIFHPAFSTDKKQVVFSATVPGKGIGLFLFERETRKLETLIAPSLKHNISHPRIFDNLILFISDYSGTPDLHAYNISTGQTERWFHPSFGIEKFAYHPQRNTIVAPIYDKNGYELATLQPNRKKIEDIPAKKAYLPTASRPIKVSKKETRALPPPKDYNRYASYFIPHSWVILPAIDPQKNEYLIGGALASQDLLDEFSYVFSGLYSASGEYSFQAGIEYKRFFPIWFFNISAFNTSSGLRKGNAIQTGFKIPLTFRNGLWYDKLNITLGGKWEQNNALQEQIPFTHLSWSHFRAKTYRDAESRKGFFVSGSYRYGLTTSSGQTAIYTEGRIPGLFKHDILKARYRFVNRTGAYVFPAVSPVIRGHNLFNFNTLHNAEFEWHSNLFYPDWGIKRLFFLKRIRMKTIFAFSQADIGTFQSYNLQLIGDWNFFGFPVELPLGFQISYIMPLKKWSYSWVIMQVVF